MPATTEKKAESTANSTKPLSKAWLWPSLTIAGAFVVLSVSVLAYIMNAYKYIYPNVYADSIKLGGLTEEQADQVVTQHIRDRLAQFSVDVEAQGVSHTFTPDNIDAGYDSGETARNAYGVGRTGNLFERIGDIFGAYFSRVEVPVVPKLVAGREVIATEIAEIAAQIDMPAKQYSYVINERDIVIQQAKDGKRIDQKSAVDETLRRFESLENGTVVIEPEVIEPEPFDIDKLRNMVYKEPKDAYVDTSDGVVIMPHQTGVDFDADKLRQDLQTDEPEITVPLIFTEPDITQQGLKANLFKDQLSSYTTYLTASNIPRTSNIKLAAGSVNNSIILPGESFSFNDTVGQRTAARGYQEAGTFVGNQLVPELGGGICQLSTTIYNAVLFANLKIVERNNHGMTVSYVPTGRDAMVNWGTSDLKFENDTGYPIQVLAEQTGSNVKVVIMGTRTNDLQVEMIGNTISKSPYQRVDRDNSALAPGTTKVVQDGYNGSVVETYRVLRDSQGNEVSRAFEAKSTYRRVDYIVEHGPAVATTVAPVTSSPAPAVPTPTPVTTPVTPTATATPEPTPEPTPTPAPEATPTPVSEPEPEAPTSAPEPVDDSGTEATE